jgi:hypothetical protein
MNTSTEYRIMVRGRVGSRFADVFESMTLEAANGDQALIGTVRDQAELRGMIDLLCGLGVEILSVSQASLRPKAA